jgi:clan AA aspartic protease
VLTGIFREGHPRLTLELPGTDGIFDVEFIIDTGFDGELSLPFRLARQLDAPLSGQATFIMANGTQRQCPYCEPVIEWAEEPRIVEVLVIEGNPLLGTQLLQDTVLHVEIMESGLVEIDTP